MPIPALENLLRHPSLFRFGERAARATDNTLQSCFPALDAILQDGWPLGALIECLPEQSGIGELSLFLPALAHLTRQGRDIVFIDPPYLPYAPALVRAGLALNQIVIITSARRTDGEWAAIQCLQSGACHALILWSNRLSARALRHLQLAAEASGALTVLFRSPRAIEQASPALLRIGLRLAAQELEIRILKHRGHPPCTVTLAPAPIH